MKRQSFPPVPPPLQPCAVRCGLSGHGLLAAAAPAPACPRCRGETVVVSCGRYVPVGA